MHNTRWRWLNLTRLVLCTFLFSLVPGPALAQESASISSDRPATPHANVPFLLSPLRESAKVTAGYNTTYHGGNDNNRADLMTLDIAPTDPNSGFGTAVYPAAGGEIWSASDSSNNCHVTIYHAQYGIFTTYYHVRPTAYGTVTTDQQIGVLGNCGGEIYGAHVHFTINEWNGTWPPLAGVPFRSNWQPLPAKICGLTFNYQGDNVRNQYKGTRIESCIMSDLTSNHNWAKDAIASIYAVGVTKGCDQTNKAYCPDRSTTRAEMAVFLIRAIYGAGYEPPAYRGIFADVPENHFAARWVEMLYDTGITTGCISGSEIQYFCPERPVTRAEMAIFLVRTRYNSSSPNLPPAEGIFTDVPADDHFAPWVEQLRRDGITNGCYTSPSLQYCPTRYVTRAEMAVFLDRQFGY